MADGIVCKVWNIHGNSLSKGVQAQLSDSIGYILDDEKTETKLHMEGSVINDPQGQLGRECQYIADDIKTVSGAYVGGNNIVFTDIKNAVREMMQVKEFYGKTDGRAALHGIISLPQNESKPENAAKLMMLCECVMKEVFPEHQAIFAVHTNTDNLHIHFIVNSVGLNGKKIHQDKNFMSQVLQPCINKYAEQFGFTQNEAWKTKEKSEKMSSPEIKMMLRNDINLAIERSNTFDDFIKNLRESGYTVNIGKYISLQNKRMGKAMRTYQLGNSYTKDSIIERIVLKKETFEDVYVGDYAMNSGEKDEVVERAFSTLPKFKDMTPEHKQQVIQKMKKGINPWREYNRINWQVNNIQAQIQRKERINAYVDYYSTDGTLQGAMDGIVAAQKKLAAERKIIAIQKKKYKPILDIYNEMKKIEKKAYLYEHENITEYRNEFEQYREYTRRLKKGYGKEISEVAGFMKECEEKLLYSRVQTQELSKEYREICQFQQETEAYGTRTRKLEDKLEIYKMYNGRKKEDDSTEIYHLVAKNSGLRIEGTSTSGKYELNVMDPEGNFLRRITNVNGTKHFMDELQLLENTYGTKEWLRFSTTEIAQRYADLQNAGGLQVQSSLRANLAQGDLSFTQAVNHCYNDKGICFIVDPQNPAYIITSEQTEDDIRITIYNQESGQEEVTHIPLVSDRTSGGFATLIKLQDKYGFSERLIAYEDMEQAKEYCKNTVQQGKKNKSDWR